MALIQTGEARVFAPPAGATDEAIARFDGITGNLIQDSGVTINDAGEITATKFIGDGSMLTNLPGGDGSGDVVGPTGPVVDNRVARFDGVTGKLIQDSVVTLDDAGAMTGLTKLGVGKLVIQDINSDTATEIKSTVPIKINTNFTVWTGGNASSTVSLTGGSMMLVDTRLITTGANQSMTIEPNGSGILTINANTTINYGSSPGITAIGTAGGTVGLRIKQGAANQGTIMDFFESGSTRKGWFGYGSSAFRQKMFIINDYANGDMEIHPGNSSSRLTVDGFTAFGVGADNIGLKVKMLKGTTSSSTTGSVTKSHGLVGENIVGFTFQIRHATNRAVGMGYEGGGGSFDNDVWYDASNFNVINNGSSIRSKPFVILVWYGGG